MCHVSGLASKLSDDKSADNVFECPLYVKSSFPLAAYMIASLSLVFKSLIIMCVGLFEFI